MRKVYTVAILCLIASFATAQSGSIKGKLLDTTFREVLSDATISILNPIDSTPVTFSIADKNGAFEIKNLDTGAFRMLITFKGYRAISKNFKIARDSSSIDFGTLYMDKESVLLQEVVVERPPITVKKD